MGVNIANLELVTDYRPKSSFIRLHMDLPVPAHQVETIRNQLTDGAFDEAFELITSNNPKLQNVDMVKAAFDEVSDLHEKEAGANLKRAV